MRTRSVQRLEVERRVRSWKRRMDDDALWEIERDCFRREIRCPLGRAFAVILALPATVRHLLDGGLS